MKNKLRRKLKIILDDLSEEYKKEASSIIAGTTANLQKWKKSETILLYFSMPEEVQTEYLIARGSKEGKRLAFPKMYGNTMKFHFVTKENMKFLKKHKYGVLEPDSSFEMFIPSKKDKALLITPGLGFTPEGVRLGRGKGYYDKYIKQFGKYLEITALAYSCQILQNIPASEFDQFIPEIVTEKTVYRP